MKKLLTIVLAVVAMARPAIADEGMWLLPFIEKLNIKDMKAKGFKLSAEDLYSLNKSAIKDAIVIFGGGCTGEIISPEGLLITNHHCGYGTIQSHSSVENDYLKNGFWAMNREQEIPSPGLSVTFVRSIQDVTDQILPKLTASMTEKERNEKVAQLVTEIAKANSNPTENLVARISPMFGGNQYLMFVQEKFGDVRMVGAPPSSIGKFGGDTDNWMWPRHTGDFAMFRVYASADNKSTANYDKANKPYAPKQHLKVSLKGYNEGDYAMILGFPGRTNRYMTSWEIDQVLEQDNPIRIFVRGERQDIIWKDMMASDKVRIQYSSKYSGSSNYWKNSIGMSRGLKKLDVRTKKVAEQDAFTAWVAADAKRAAYGEGLPLIEKAVAARRPLAKESQYISECLNNMEAIRFAASVDYLLKSKMAPDAIAKALQEGGDAFFKNYSQATDRKVTPRLIEIFVKDSGSPLTEQVGKLSMDELFGTSIFVDQAKFNAFVKNNPTSEAIAQDPAVAISLAITARAQEISTALAPYGEMFARGHRLYLAGLLEMTAGKKSLYPDANSTLRMTYGQVLPYKAADAVFYDFNTTLSGVVAKRDNTSPEFTLPDRLVELWKNKDFGRYAHKGDVPVAFLSNNDITGGNSGSPVLNDKGELLGLAFDGNWEAMSGDIAFEPEVQRTISVDIRYVLFVVDKYAGASHLINEMTIVE